MINQLENLNIINEIYQIIANLIEDKKIKIQDDMPLIGSESVLDSMQLVELCLPEASSQTKSSLPSSPRWRWPWLPPP